MTPEEKAEELFVRFNKDGLQQISTIINRTVRKQMIKQCAVIAADEVLSYMGADRGAEFWQEVKIEIEKL